MTIFTFYKIKDGKKEIWEKWCKEIMTNHFNEAQKALFEEDLIRERCILMGDYVFYEHCCLPSGKRPLHRTEKEISIKHNDIFNECLEFVDSGQIGYDLIA